MSRPLTNFAGGGQQFLLAEGVYVNDLAPGGLGGLEGFCFCFLQDTDTQRRIDCLLTGCGVDLATFERLMQLFMQWRARVEQAAGVL